jgi:kynureninase
VDVTDVPRAQALALDAADPLADLPRQFVPAEPELVYLDGNSLGRLPLRTAQRVRDFTEHEWGQQLVRGWHHWERLPLSVGDRIGRSVLGAGEDQVVVTDTITTNLYKAVHAAIDLQPSRRVLVTDARNFPTDRYVLEGVAAQRGLEVRWVTGDPVHGVAVEHLVDVLDDDVALVSLQHVDYRSGALAQLGRLTKQVHAAGALMLWDLAHSAGSVPVELDAHDVDLAVGCTYKYLNAGPGAPGYLYVNRRLQERMSSPIHGWWSKQDPFAMDEAYRPAGGVARFLSGSPSVLGTLAVDASVSMIEEVGVAALRQRSVALVSFLVALADEHLLPLGFELRSPSDASRRGGHVVLAHPDAYAIGAALVERAHLVPDVRPPDLIRLSPAPTSTTFVEVWDGVARITDLVASRNYEPTPRGRIT